MGKKSFALGRSLSDILRDHSAPAASDIQQSNSQSGDNSADNSAAVDNSEKIVEINVDLIDPNPFQPRKVFSDDELVELAESIEQHGLIQPIAVRKVGDRYQLISGERRTRASKLAGLPTIKAQVYENLDDKAMAEWALIENIQRVDLNPVEVAKSYQHLPLLMHSACSSSRPRFSCGSKKARFLAVRPAPSAATRSKIPKHSPSAPSKKA